MLNVVFGKIPSRDIQQMANPIGDVFLEEIDVGPPVFPNLAMLMFVV